MAPVRIVVDKLDGSEHACELERTASVLELKLQVEKASGIPPDRQRLVHKSSIILLAEERLEEYVEPGDHIMMVVTPPNHFVLAGYGNCCARLWVAETGECLITYKGHEKRLRSASASPDGSMVVTSSEDGTAKIWDAKIGKCLHTLEGHAGPVCCATFSPDSKNVVTASVDGDARMWYAETGRPLVKSTMDSTFTWLARHATCAQFVMWGLCGDRILTAAGEEAFLWATSVPAARIKKFTGHIDLITSASLSHDGRYVLTASKDHTARLWNVATGVCTEQFVGHMEPVNCASFSPNGTQILTAGGGLCILWHAALGTRLRDFDSHGAIMNSCSFSIDGAVALTASSDGYVRLWDVNDGECVEKFKPERAGPAICASFCT
jgi:WD40 repeat protein